MALTTPAPHPETPVDRLSEWEKGPPEQKAVQGGRSFSVIRRQFSSLQQRASSLFGRSPHSSVAAKDLKSVLLEIHKEISGIQDEAVKAAQIERLKTIYGNIASEFDLARKDTSKKGLLRASDLLEAYNTAFSTGESIVPLGLSRIKVSRSPPDPVQAHAIEQATKPSKLALAQSSQQAILLADYQTLADLTLKIEDAQKTKDAKGKGPLTHEEVAQLVSSGDLHLEPAPMGKMIDYMYRHHFKGRLQMEKVVTLVAEIRFRSGKLVQDVLKTVKFFKNLHIDLWMDIGGELYSFSELFGYDIREAKSYHESFTRSLTPESQELILTKTGYRALQADVRKTTGDAASQVVCVNSFSRVSVIPCKAGSIDDERSIRGKVLSPSSPPEAELAEKPEDAYAQRSPFTIHDLLGGYGPQEEGLQDPKKKQDTDSIAQGALLGMLSSMVDHHDTTMVIQRLAPADVHRYSATANETVLSRAECCAVLHKEIEQRERLGEPLSDEEKNQLNQLRALEKHFQEEELASPTGVQKKSTFNIAGSTLGSVSTKAVRQEPSILATNDRKVMMVRHDDGSIAIHVFIGASAVNSVGVTAKPGSAQAGADFGDMSFGRKEKGDWITAKTGDRAMPLPTPPKPTMLTRALQSIQKWRSRRGVDKKVLEEREQEVKKKREIAVTAAGTGFSEGGSTVISIYMNRDYRVVEPVARFVEAGVRQIEGKVPENLEFQSRLGDPLATPVSYQTLTFIAKLETRFAEHLEGTPLEKIQTFAILLQRLPEEERKSNPLAQQWIRILQEAPTATSIEELKNSVSGDDRYILEKLLATSSFKEPAPLDPAP